MATNNQYITMVFVRADQAEELKQLLEKERIRYVIEADSPREVFNYLHSESSDLKPNQRALDTAYLETIPSWRRRQLKELSPVHRDYENSN